MSTLYDEIRQNCRLEPVELHRQAGQELHLAVREGEDMPRVARRLAELECEPVMQFASDERRLEAGAHKIHLVLSAPDGHLIILEQSLTLLGRSSEYYSVREAFPWVLRWEQEIAELFGLAPCNLPLPPTQRKVLEGGPYRADCHPLDRTRSMAELRTELDAGTYAEAPLSTTMETGMLFIAAGPVHAGHKEAAEIEIRVAGETIESLEVHPGRKHRGVEKKLESLALEDGWRLAEVIDGQAAVAHALASCMAVESIAGVEPSPAAEAWRAVLLELERITNHISTCATLIQDFKALAVSSPMSALRERVRHLNEQLTGSRWLKGVVRPGGVALAPGLDPAQLVAGLESIVADFARLAVAVMQSPPCRDRLIGTGVLTGDEARRWGAPGLVRRASGAIDYDWRLRHPSGAYLRPDVRAEILDMIPERAGGAAAGKPHGRGAPALRLRDLAGDNFARFALRVAEVETALRIIRRLAAGLDASPVEPAPVAEALAAADPFQMGFGCTESPRGGVATCAVRGLGRLPLRCKDVGPSEALLRSFAAASAARAEDGRGEPLRGDIVADTPLTNVAINASPVECAG